jgi:hypothetical protein
MELANAQRVKKSGENMKVWDERIGWHACWPMLHRFTSTLTTLACCINRLYELNSSGPDIFLKTVHLSVHKRGSVADITLTMQVTRPTVIVRMHHHVYPCYSNLQK